MSETTATPNKYSVLWAFTVAVAFTLITLGWLTQTAFRSHQFITVQLLEAVRMEELRGEILLMDEVLTMSVRMAAATSEPRWEVRYLQVEPQLNKALKEATRLAPTLVGSQAVLQTDTANTRLVVLEKRAFELERQGQPAAAQQLLNGAEYEAHKKAYSAGMAEIDRLLQQSSSKLQFKQRVALRWSVIMAAIAAPLLILSWLIVLRTLWRWQSSVMASNQQLNRQTAELRAHKERFDQLAEQSGIIAWEVDSENVFTYVSQVAASVLGYHPEELLGRRHFYDLHADAKADALAVFARKQPFQNLEQTLQAKDGRIVHVSTSGLPLLNNDGTLRGYRGSFSDITEHKRMEEVMRLTQFSVDKASEVIAWIRANGTYAYVNDAACHFLGYSRDELVNKSVPDINSHMTLEKWGTLWEQLKQVKTMSYETLFVTKDGRRVPVEATVNYLAFEGQEYSCGFARDISERKRAEEALRESEERFRKLFEGHSVVKLVIEPDTGKIIDANEAAANYYGWSAVELKEMNIQQINMLPPETVKSEIETVCASRRTHFEFRHRRADGSIRDVEVFTNKIEIAGKVLLYSIIHDITDRKQVEEALQDKSQELERYFTSSLDLLCIANTAGQFLRLNPEWEKVLGYSLAELEGQLFLDFVHPDDMESTLAAVSRLNSQDKILNFENRYRCHDGSYRWIEWRSVPKGDLIYAVARDITERKRAEAEKEKLEAQNLHLQKSESLGRMAGAIAHHFNNQLQGVMMNLELAMADLSQKTDPTEELTGALQCTRKAAEVSSLMLTYLGQTHCQNERLDFSATCAQSLSLLLAIKPQNTVFETDFPTPGPVIHANANQIQQMLTNLISNAWESGGEKGGAIRLSVQTVSAGDIPTRHRFPIDFQIQDAIYACLGVEDIGCGIPDKDIDKIFDPFFTSKFTGRGMGLAVVLGIVRAHHGAIAVESKPGQGSTFRIFIPLLGETSPKETKPASSTSKTKVDPSSCSSPGVTVLVVDDEPIVRNTAALVLIHMGFKVLLAEDGFKAVNLFQERQSEIGCVLCDLTMPGMSGWETLTAMRQLSPGIPVILSSGYSEAQVMEGHHPELPQAFLNKPYDFTALSDALNRVLTNKKV